MSAPLLDGAVRSGAHVLLRRDQAEAYARVITVGGARDVDRWYALAAAANNPLAFRVDAAGLPRFVALVRHEPRFTERDRERFGAGLLDRLRDGAPAYALILDVPDGVSLFEIALRTDLQRAALEPAIVATALARAARLASTPREPGAEFAPTFEAQTVRVAWDGAICFLGHESWDRTTWASLQMAGTNTGRRGRALVDRFLRQEKRAASLLAWMNVIATSRDDVGLAADPSPWSVVADALDEILRDLGGPVDAATLAGLTQRLFPDDHRRALDVREQIAMLGDDELLAVPDATLAG